MIKGKPFRAYAYRPGEGRTEGLMFHDFSMFSGRFATETEAKQSALAALSEDNPVIVVERAYSDYRKAPKKLAEYNFGELDGRKVRINYAAGGWIQKYVGTFRSAQETLRQFLANGTECTFEFEA